MRKYLINLRMKANESIQSVADAIGISRQYYSFIEAGERQKKMDITLVSRIANHFGVTVEDIVNEEESIRREANTNAPA